MKLLCIYPHSSFNKKLPDISIIFTQQVCVPKGMGKHLTLFAGFVCSLENP